MALPTTVVSNAQPPGNNPPHKASNGNFYAVAQTGAVDLNVYKATDPTSSWTAQDTSNNPTDNATCLSSIYDGTLIHIVYFASNQSGELRYRAFDTSDDTWQTGGAVGTIEHPANDPGWPWCDIAIRSDGDIIVCYNGSRDKVMGNEKERVDYARYEGTSWSAGNSVDGGAANDIHYGFPVTAKSDTDRIHFVFNEQASTTNDPPVSWDDVHGRTLDGSNSLSTVYAGSGISAGPVDGPISNLVFWMDTSTSPNTRRLLAFKRQSTIASDARFLPVSMDANGDITSIATQNLATQIDMSATDTGGASLALNPDDNLLTVVYIDGASADIFYNNAANQNPNGGTDMDTTSTEHRDAVTATTMISAKFYDRSGTKLAMLYMRSDGGNKLIYDEIDYATGTTHEVALSQAVDMGATFVRDYTAGAALTQAMDVGGSFVANAVFERALTQAIDVGATLQSNAVFESALAQAAQFDSTYAAGLTIEAALSYAIKFFGPDSSLLNNLVHQADVNSRGRSDNAPYDWQNNLLATNVASPSTYTGDGGYIAMSYNGTSQLSYFTNAQIGSAIGGLDGQEQDYTVAVRMRAPTGVHSGGAGYFFTMLEVNAVDFFLATINTTDVTRVVDFWKDFPSALDVDGSIDIGDSNERVIIITYDAATDTMSLYVDSSTVTDDTHVQDKDQDGDWAQTLSWGGQYNEGVGNSNFFQGDVFWSAAWTRVLTSTERAELISRPNPFIRGYAVDAQSVLEAALSQALNVGATVVADATLEAALTQAANMGATLDAQSVLEAALTEGADMGATFLANAIYEAALTQAIQAGFTSDSEISVDASISFALQTGATFVALAIFEAALAQSVDAGFTVAANADFESALAETLNVGATLAADATFAAALQQAMTVAAAVDADITIEAALTLASQYAATFAADLILEAALTEAIQAGADFTVEGIFEAALSQGLDVGAAFTAEKILTAALLVAADIGATFDGEIAAQVVEAALTEALEMAATFAADRTAEAAFTEQVIVNATQSATAILEAALTQSAAFDITLAGNVDLDVAWSQAFQAGAAFDFDTNIEAFLAFSTDIGFSTSAQQVAEVALTEGLDVNAAFVAATVVEAALTQSAQFGFSADSFISKEAALTFGANLDFAADREYTAEGALVESMVLDAVTSVLADLNVQLNEGISVGAESSASMVLETGLTVAISAQMTLDGLAISSTVVTPDERTFQVLLTPRTFQTPAENRTFTPPEQPRTDYED